MANNSRRRQRSRRQSRRNRRVQPSRRTRASNSTPRLVGRLISSGVRTLLGVLPGSSITTPVADFVFKSLGVSTAQPKVDTSIKVTTFDATYPIQVNGSVSLTPASIYTAMRGSVYNPSTANAVLSMYKSARILSLSVRLIPTNVEGGRNGELNLGLQPRFSVDTPAAATSILDQPSYLSSLYVSTKGSGDKPLRIDYKPKASDGRVYGFMDMSDVFCDVIVIYSQPMRSNYGSFTVQDFAAQIEVRARMEFRDGDGTGYPTSYSNMVVDNLASTAYAVRCVADSHVYVFRSGATIKELVGETGTTGVSVSGRTSAVRKHPVFRTSASVDSAAIAALQEMEM